jgi:hypothetical protein
MRHIMKWILSLLLSLPVLAFSQTKPSNCASFKKGKFAYRDSASNTIHEFKRTGGHQVEKNKQTGISTKYKIEWISDCEYKLTQLYATSKEARKKNGNWLVYTIVGTTESSYTYRCSCSNSTEIQGTVVKME